MAEIGSVINDKYEILKEIGRGGMSVVYLAMDKNLNKQWAVKEIRKKGKGKDDEIIVNSLLAEANMMKKLDHPALPRIVDIIDNGVTIYVVLDYIEGESLDKILNRYGAQPEEMVIGWAKQVCDALSYLHSQKPPIIYRDMKPSNVMLKPEGNIKIIDFGIAREYKEQNLSDTTVLGTKGYAPPEQYNGQTDARSDIYALGMTMHHLLTGVDPRRGEAYVPVRQWNPELSEGIEIIIDRCVQPAAENRYQSCTDLLYDLEHPELITRGFKRRQKIRLACFVTSFILSILLAITGGVLRLAATNVNNRDYNANISESNPEKYFNAIKIYPERVEAYNLLIEYYNAREAKNEEIIKIGNTIEANGEVLDLSNADITDMYYDMGRLYFSMEDSLKSRAVSARNFFKKAAESEVDFDKKSLAECYLSICEFMTNQSKSSENSLADFEALFEKIQKAVNIVDNTNDDEANYDKISLYYVVMLLMNDQAEYMAAVGFERQTTLDLMNELYNKVSGIVSTLNYVNDLKNEIINVDYSLFLTNINAKYNEVEKRQQGGN